MADTDTPLPAERWSAPEHATGVTLSTGPIDVVDGEIEVPANTSVGDRGGLIANGFRPADPAPAPAAAPMMPLAKLAPEREPAPSSDGTASE